jgi:diaminopimelate epimerase
VKESGTGLADHFHKYQALGNDMLVIDPAFFPHPLSAELIRRICHRNFGIGADGICCGPLPDERPRLAMRFFNPDGSEAEKSGNGLRIFARYLWDAEYVGHQDGGRTFTMHINNEPIETTIEDEDANRITTALGRLSFSRPFTTNSLYEIVGAYMTPDEIAAGATAVNIGNPHCVLFVESVSAERVRQIGPVLETAVPFPNRTNVQLVQVIDPHTIQIEIWERGAGYTLASGTSASAAAGAALYNGRCQSPVEVRMAGGSAVVAIDEDWEVKLTGSVQPVFAGTLSKVFFE